MIRGCVSIIAALVSLGVSVLALVIVVYVSIKLTDLTYEVGTNEISGQCFLGTNAYDLSFSSNNCLMLQILGGLTIGLGIVIGIIQCYTCYLCGLGGVLDGLFGLAGAGAWGAAAGIIESAVESDGSLTDAASERISSSGLADEVSSLNSERDTGWYRASIDAPEIYVRGGRAPWLLVHYSKVPTLGVQGKSQRDFWCDGTMILE